MKVQEAVVSSFQKSVKLFEAGNYEEALRSFARSREIAVQNSFEHYAEESRNYIAQTKNAISEKHYKIGFDYAQKNKIESAAYEYRKALEYNPENVSAKTELGAISTKLAQDYYEQGMSMFSKGDPVKAREYFKKSLYYQPDKIESLRALERIK
jgi:tetratricopeptide (TPR) repeat protein